ncbi:PP2C family protein-serine/threonine phosphatase [Pseudobacteriovorax antillogorgiicola]|uniref:Protein phosphatase n=1 Tax=Pseudobacteriovorax antillogorgiicola TaxID=1513793 RepID=A0A1Y6BUH8_9BACT|nr:protein phosphatase 2C domain-containing protein [Pseudobacteriovorax antillogorgiicola]TCS53812.1 protein phosphatase [Pseudobacteriovorax antillogorgiicola]SMF22004.1 protein phosphatase [Pseudobacteriovorax antillogorgiicola]
MRIVIYGKTDIGRTRKNNQDSLYVSSEHGLVVVADGIGGRKGGEVASKMAVDGMKQAYLSCDSLRHEEVSPFLIKSIDKVNQSIIKHGKKHSEVEGLATTLNCLLFVGEKAYICHLGDSRTYLYYKANMWQLTFDHNIENYVERGWLPDETLMNNSKPGALVRALGLAEECDVDIYEINLKPGEILITCSDGLTSMVSDSEIRKIVQANSHQLHHLPKLLVDTANRNGGQDNITVAISGVLRD